MKNLKQRAAELGISVSEYTIRCVTFVRTIEKYFENGQSQLVIFDPKNWDQNEMGLPYEEIILNKKVT